MKNIVTQIKRHLHQAVGLIAVCTLAGMSISCNDELERVERGEYPEPGQVEVRKNKVLWVIMDGAGGTAVRQARNNQYAPHIRKMVDNAVYTFDGLADAYASETVTKERGWANLMTGSTRHGVKEAEELAHLSVPTVVELMKQQSPQMQVSVLAADTAFSETFGKKADISLVGEDKEMVSKAMEALNQDETPDFLVLELAGARLAGEANGFYDETGQYATPALLQAIRQLDTYVGKLKEVIVERNKLHRENWILMLTSGFGGATDMEGATAYEQADRNVFSMIYSPNLQSELQQKPANGEGLEYTYFTPSYAGQGYTDYACVNDPTLFDFHFDTEEEDTTKVTNYTVQFMYYASNSGNKDYSLVSKATRTGAGWKNGWEVRCRWGQYIFCGDGWAYTTESGTDRTDDRRWHVKTFVFDYRKKELRMYLDGHFEMHSGRTKWLGANHGVGDAAPLTIGKIKNSATWNNGYFCITNLQVYNVALPEEFIKKNYMLTALDQKAEEYEYWDELIGYWPCDREEDYRSDVLLDYSQYGSVFGGENAGRSDMTLSPQAVWTTGSSQEEHVRPSLSAAYFQKVFNNVDFACQTFQWLGLSIDEAWGWEGISRGLSYQNLATTH